MNGADRLDHPLPVQDPAPLLRGQHIRNLAQVGSREVQPAHVGLEPGHVGQRHHLDRVLGAVQERPEHLRVVVLAVEAVHARHVVRVHLAETPREARALAGRHQPEAERASPVAELGGQRRLVAVGQAVDHTCGLGELPQMEACQHVGLHRYHGYVLAGQDGAIRVPHPHLDQAGRFDDDVDGAGDQRIRVGGHHRRAVGHGFRDLIGGGGPQRLPFRARAQHGGSRPHPQVGDDGQPHAGHVPDLAGDLGAEDADADQPDPDRRSLSLALDHSLVQHAARVVAPPRCQQADRHDAASVRSLGGERAHPGRRRPDERPGGTLPTWKPPRWRNYEMRVVTTTTMR